MKKFKYLVFAALVLCAAFLTAPAEIYAEPEMVVIYAQVPSDWEEPHIWAWGPRGDAFPQWPGGAMQPDDNNPGWFYIFIPADKVGALVNANEGSIQTGDFVFEGEPIWVTVSEDGSFEVTTDQQTTGDLPRPIAMVVVYAQVPADWEAPGIWAWGPRGDAFPSWPGGAMQADANNPGWYFAHIPSDKTGALINAVGGSVQTSDFVFEGVPIWVTVSDDAAFEITTDRQTAGDLPAYVPNEAIPVTADLVAADVTVVYAQVPADWENPGIWAWGPRGDAFPSWPGGAMQADPNNPGWYFAHIPSDKTGALINANEGSVQTGDFTFDGTPVWVTVNEDTSFEITTDQQTDGDLPVYDGRFDFAGIPAEEDIPEPVDVPDVGTIALRAQVPAAWMDPGVWAWNDGEGIGNVFGGWPGETFADMDGDWHIMHLPAWIDHIIINAIGGGVQTDDIPVEVGRDIWIAILDGEGNFYISHEEFDPAELDTEDAGPQLAERQAPVAIVADPPAEAPAPEPVPEPTDEGGLSVALIIVIIAAAVVVAGAAVVIILKVVKKKKDNAKGE